MQYRVSWYVLGILYTQTLYMVMILIMASVAIRLYDAACIDAKYVVLQPGFTWKAGQHIPDHVVVNWPVQR